MSLDIGPILDAWNHDPSTLQVRLIDGDDGQIKIQTRLDLGLLQMELDGRPDGQKPNGFDSWLDYYESLTREAAARGERRMLDRQAHADLMREGVQYYHRYIALFHLEKYDLVARDTERNLRLFAFVVEHTEDRREASAFDQYRPYVLMMRAQALAKTALARGNTPAAIRRIDEGVAAIRGFLREYGQEAREDQNVEITFLNQWREDLQRQRAIDPAEQLRERLELAIASENYEEAARLRDQIRRLGAPGATESEPPHP